MKPTALLFHVMLVQVGLLLVGCSFNNEKKEVVAIAGCEIELKVVPVKKEIAAPLTQPVDTKHSLPKGTNTEIENVLIRTIEDEVVSSDCHIIPPPIEEEDSLSIKEDTDNAFMVCNLETEAEYPGGTKAWLRYLSNNLKYPTDSVGNVIQGTVKVQFVIDSAGNVTDIKAISGSEPLSTEAVRVIKKSDKWIPAKRMSNGRCVRSYKVQPVIFNAM